MKQLILASLLLIPVISFAQKNDSKITKAAIGVSAVSGTGAYLLKKQLQLPESYPEKKIDSYLKMRDKVVYKASHPKITTSAEIAKIQRLIQNGDEIVVTTVHKVTPYERFHTDGPGMEEFVAGDKTLSKSNPQDLKRLISELKEGDYVESIVKKDNKFRIKILRRVTKAQVALTALSLSSAGAAVLNLSTGSNKKAASRFNSSRSVVEKPTSSSRNVAGTKNAKVSRQ